MALVALVLLARSKALLLIEIFWKTLCVLVGPPPEADVLSCFLSSGLEAVSMNFSKRCVLLMEIKRCCQVIFGLNFRNDLLP